MTDPVRENREQLARLLAWESIASSARLQALLQYLGEAALSSPPLRVRESMIAVELFDRGADFDPRFDSIVRVQTSRLRQKLREYYNLEEHAGEIRVEIPPGSYAVHFVRQVQAPPPPLPVAAPFPANEAFVAPRSALNPVIWIAGLLAVSSLFGYLALPSSRNGSAIAFERIGIPPGLFDTARFSPDGDTVYFGHKPAGKMTEIRGRNLKTQEEELYARAEGTLVAVSDREFFLLTDKQDLVAIEIAAAKAGSSPEPRKIADNVAFAHLGPDRKTLLLDRIVGNQAYLEYPPGVVVAVAKSNRGDPFHWAVLSPDRRMVAFGEPDSSTMDDHLAVLELDPKGPVKKVLSRNWVDLCSVVWSPDGKKVWAGGARRNEQPHIYEIGLDGSTRPLTQTMHSLALQDVRSDGLLLAKELVSRPRISGKFPNQRDDVNLAWGEDSASWGITPDGDKVLITEPDPTDPNNNAVYLRATHGKETPTRLTTGHYPVMSPDGAQLLTLRNVSGKQRLIWMPLAAGRAGNERDITAPGFHYSDISWSPDGQSFLFYGGPAGSPDRGYSQTIQGAQPPQPVTETGEWPAVRLPGLPDLYFKRGDDLIARPFPAGGPERKIGNQILRNVRFQSSVLYSPPTLMVWTVNLPVLDHVRIEGMDPQTGARRTLFDLRLPPNEMPRTRIYAPTLDGKWFASSVTVLTTSLFLVHGMPR